MKVGFLGFAHLLPPAAIERQNLKVWIESSDIEGMAWPGPAAVSGILAWDEKRANNGYEPDIMAWHDMASISFVMSTD